MDTVERRRTCLYIGNAFWLLGIALMFAGWAQYAWAPIAWGGFALGYRAALTNR